MIDRAEYIKSFKNGKKDAVRLYDNEELVAKIYFTNRYSELGIRSAFPFGGWQKTWDWGETRFELGVRVQYEAVFYNESGRQVLRTKCIECFGFDPGPVPD